MHQQLVPSKANIVRDRTASNEREKNMAGIRDREIPSKRSIKSVVLNRTITPVIRASYLTSANANFWVKIRGETSIENFKKFEESLVAALQSRPP